LTLLKRHSRRHQPDEGSGFALTRASQPRPSRCAKAHHTARNRADGVLAKETITRLHTAITPLTRGRWINQDGLRYR
jgi:hypothetical protein